MVETQSFNVNETILNISSIGSGNPLFLNKSTSFAWITEQNGRASSLTFTIEPEIYYVSAPYQESSQVEVFTDIFITGNLSSNLNPTGLFLSSNMSSSKNLSYSYEREFPQFNPAWNQSRNTSIPDKEMYIGFSQYTPVNYTSSSEVINLLNKPSWSLLSGYSGNTYNFSYYSYFEAHMYSPYLYIGTHHFGYSVKLLGLSQTTEVYGTITYMIQ